MPLGKEKQKLWMREYRLRKKGVIPNVIPSEGIVKSKIPKIPGLVMEGNVIVGVEKGVKSTNEIPICTERNYRQFKVGEKVRVWRGKRLVEVEVPEIDAEGNPM